MESITITDRLESAANSGVDEIYLYAWNNTKKRLEKEGLKFEETAIKSTRKGEHYYRISWAHAVVEDLPDNWTFSEIVDSHWDLSQSQLLWLMTQEAKKAKNNS